MRGVDIQTGEQTLSHRADWTIYIFELCAADVPQMNEWIL